MASLSSLLTKNVYFDPDRDTGVKYENGDVVQLHGLNKVEWNGKHAIIIGDVIIKQNIRRWPIQLKHNKSIKASIKECNLKSIGKIAVMYQVKINDPVDEHIEKSFSFQH
eukprot:30193_1